MICLHNECGLCLTVIRFTSVYTCTAVDGHEDVMMIFLTDSRARLICVGGHAVSFNLSSVEYIILFHFEFMQLKNVKL